MSAITNPISPSQGVQEHEEQRWRLADEFWPDVALVDELYPEVSPDEEQPAVWRRVWLAGCCLLEIDAARAARHPLGQALTHRVIAALSTLITHDKLEPRERAAAASILSALGDPRDLDEMIPVREGPFLMGSRPDQVEAVFVQMRAFYSSFIEEGRFTEQTLRGWVEDEAPQHTVHLPDFRIGKYPVTNAQYARFVAATGHAAPKHWPSPTPPPELLNHPVVNVDWYDATAYCAWLSQERGETVRLPSEAEWEKAARGDTGWVYPWGDTFDARRCNMEQTELTRTSSVGIFLAGASPYGCLDMAGNVWEWMHSVFKDYPYEATDGREDKHTDAPRVRRGGSYDLNEFVGRCTYRFRHNPDHPRHNLGFRVLSPGL